jgi:hypothetical protein
VTEPPAVDHLGAWRARKAGTDDPYAQPAEGAEVPIAGREAYGQAILDGELARVRAAVKGTRNNTLNVAAVKIGRAVAGGHLDGDAAVAQLITAGVETGLTRHETIATVRSGMRYGQRYPRDPDAAETSRNRHSDETPRVPAPTDVTDRLPAPATPAPRAPEAPPRLDVTGYLRPATWLLDRPADPPPIWGEPGAPLWAPGQSLMLAALPGLGKSTLAVQLVRARLGLDPAVLDAPVTEGKRVLYLCMDRPEQIAGLIMRAVGRDELADVGDRLVLGWGPPPADVARRPELLAELAATAQADTLVIDSLKDAAIKLTDDEIGAAYNRARQTVITAGVEVLELHHLVKRNADGKPPSSLADVYGSAHLTSGAGSVLVLVGESGDPIVRALHLKPLREPWGPAWLTHDHEAGRTAVHDRVDPLALLARTQVQTAGSLATALFETEKPSKAQTEKARRHLERLVRAGLAYAEPGRAGGGEDRAPTRYHPHTRPPTPWEAHEAQPTMEG